ncbi:NAD(P)-binding protein [Hypoxylon sp. NC1633]|nr:NAD(P)-binding protein [Hypoxylon sp. NC1633]
MSSIRSASSRVVAQALASSSSRRLATIISPQFQYTPSTVHVRTMASIPSTMKGVVIDKPGGTEVLRHVSDLPVPSLVEGQILVKNDYIGVNFIDTYFRTGLYPAPQFPYILGREAEGTVVKTGGGELYGLKEGDKVVWMAEGAYAEYTSVSAEKAVKVPTGIAPKIASAALLQGLTALTLIREAHPVQKGEWVLVHAAAGGTGLWLCQLLRAIGAHTIGTASTADKTALALKAGAEHVINYSHEDVAAKVRELTGGQGVAAVFDGVGKSTFELSLEVLARKGSLVSFGNASGAVPPFTIARLAAKNVRLLRPSVTSYVVSHDDLQAFSEDLFDIIEKNKLDVKIHDVYPLSDVARAQEDLEGRKTTGKVLLDPSK